MLKKLSYWVSVAIVGAVVGFTLQFAKAWTEPTSTPPLDNVGAPITAGDTFQSKGAGLELNKNNKSLYGLLVDYGNVGIGATNPQSKLSIGGNGTAGVDITNYGTSLPSYGAQLFGTAVAIYGAGAGTGSYGIIGVGDKAGVYSYAVGNNFGGYFVKNPGTHSGQGLYAESICLGTESNCITEWPAGFGSGSSSLWAASGNDIYSSNIGKVGVGVTTSDYLPSSGNWNYTLLLNAQDTSSIGFHDANASVSSIRYNNSGFTIGGDDGWGIRNVSMPGTASVGYLNVAAQNSTTEGGEISLAEARPGGAWNRQSWQMDVVNNGGLNRLRFHTRSAEMFSVDEWGNVTAAGAVHAAGALYAGAGKPVYACANYPVGTYAPATGYIQPTTYPGGYIAGSSTCSGQITTDSSSTCRVSKLNNDNGWYATYPCALYGYMAVPL